MKIVKFEGSNRSLKIVNRSSVRSIYVSQLRGRLYIITGSLLLLLAAEASQGTEGRTNKRKLEMYVCALDAYMYCLLTQNVGR